jgi:hypothetical protein
MKNKYQVIHKLTQKPVRCPVSLEVFTFETAADAQVLVDAKNRIMGAVFYKVAKIEVKP